MSLRIALCVALLTILISATPADEAQRVPPYGVVQFGFGSMTNPEDREFMLRCHVNVCESAVYHGVNECFGPRDRDQIDELWAKARESLEELHGLGIKAVSYVAYHPFYGNAEERTGLFDFYDNRWEQFADYLGPKPPDPMEWVKRNPDGSPMPFQYRTSKGYYICPNNPYWLQYLDGVLQMIADAGLDGCRYDGPINPCHCRWCAEAFGKWLRQRYSARELAEHFGIKGDGPVPPPTDKNDPLMFLWRHYGMFRQGETVAETAAKVRRYNPDFIMSYNYCIWGAHLAGSSRNEYLARASDYALIEGNFNATAHSENGRKHSASADCKYLLASSDGKPVDLHYYMYPLAQMTGWELQRLPQQQVEGLANFWRAAIAEGMAGGCPYPIMVSRAHHNVRRDIIAYSDFFYRMRPYLTGARTYANVAILASVSQTCADLPSYPLSVSRYLTDQHIPHKLAIERDLTDQRLAEYDALILPEARLLADDQVAFLKDWVRSGHGLVMFGPVATRDQYNEEREVSAFADVLALENGQFPQEPIKATYGQGRLAWLPTPKLSTCGRWPLSEEAARGLRRLPSALHWVAGSGFSARLWGPEMVELNLMRSPDGNVLLCHMVNYAVEVPDIVVGYQNLPLEIALPDGADPQRVLLFSPDHAYEREELPYQIIERGRQRLVAVTVPAIWIYNLIAVELAGQRPDPPPDARPPVELFISGPSLAAPGDEIGLGTTLSNRGQETVTDCRITVTLPSQWDAHDQTLVEISSLEDGSARVHTLDVTVAPSAKPETPSVVQFAATYTVAGRQLTDSVKHRVMVLRPVTAELGVSEQISPLTRRLGLQLSLGNITSTDLTGTVSLSLPEGWTDETGRLDFTLPARGTDRLAFTVVAPVQAVADKYPVEATAEYTFAGRQFETKAQHEFELRGNLLVAECPYTPQPPQLDGKLDDDCWAAATRLGDFVRINGSAPATDQTDCLVLYDDRNLYVAYRCHESLLDELVANSTADGGALWEDDSIEVWIDVGHKHKQPIQLTANCVGAKLSNPSGKDWQAVAGRETGAWTLELAIPWAALGRIPQTGELWGFNLCRSRQAKGLAQREYSAWSCTYGGFTRVENFGHLLFAAK